MKRAVPIGYSHIWGYRGVWKEKKHKGYWNIDFQATKSHKHKSMGNFGVGTKGAWKINGIQYIVKTGKNTYRTRLIGKKYPMKFYVKKHSRKRY